jgi:hypothetical protein
MAGVLALVGDLATILGLAHPPTAIDVRMDARTVLRVGIEARTETHVAADMVAEVTAPIEFNAE